MTSPSGPISLPGQYLENMLAACSAFQTWVGAEDATEAAASIYQEGLPAPSGGADAYTAAQLAALRPYAVIYQDAERRGWRRSRIGEGAWVDAGRLLVVLKQTSTDANDGEPTADANVVFKNTVGSIVSGLCDLRDNSGSGYLMIEEIGIEDGPYWPDKRQSVAQGLWVAMDLFVEWGE